MFLKNKNNNNENKQNNANNDFCLSLWQKPTSSIIYANICISKQNLFVLRQSMCFECSLISMVSANLQYIFLFHFFLLLIISMKFLNIFFGQNWSELDPFNMLYYYVVSSRNRFFFSLLLLAKHWIIKIMKFQSFCMFFFLFYYYFSLSFPFSISAFKWSEWTSKV